MATTAIFGKRIAQKIFLSFVLPLVVLLVAGLLVPVFLWFSLDRFRQEYDARADLVAMVDTMQKAAQDRDTALRNFRQYRAQEFRKEMGDAIATYQGSIYSLFDWLDKHPDDDFRQAFDRSRMSFGQWNQVARDPLRPIPSFDSVRQDLALLSRMAVERRVSYFPLYQRAEIFRRVAAVIVPMIAMLAALLIGRAIALGITRPLEALTEASEALKSGGSPWVAGASDLSFKEVPNDEIGDLQRAFLEMARAIGQREAVLRAQNEALVAIRRRIEAVLNATNDGIVMLDRMGGFSVVNRRFAYFFGVEPEDLQDHTFEQVRPLLLSKFRNKDLVRERLRDVLRDTESIADETYEIINHPLVRTIRLFSAPVRGEAAPDGAPSELLGRIVVIRDVTRETEVDRMKTEFVSTVSHELRTPLTAIKGYVDLIVRGKAGPLSELQTEFLTMVQGSTERLTALINDILDISRIESGRVELRRESVVYAPLVQQTVRMLAGEAEAKGISLAAELPGRELPGVLGDAERITQVLVNLVSNAIKYTPSGGVVTVSVRGEGNFVATCVADTGIGVATEDRERIFQKFYRADNSTTRETGGTGLGLAITKAVVERLGGSIWVESDPGKGSRFWFTLPAAGEIDLVTETVPAAAKRRKLYLIVDSEIDTLHRVAHALRPQNIIASAAAAPAEALRRARGLRPDAILIDPLTAAFDAWDLLRTLRGDPAASRVPIIYYALERGSSFLEAQDTLRLVRPPVPGEDQDAFAASLHSALSAGAAPGPGATVMVLGPSTIIAAVRQALGGRESGTVLGAGSPEEAERRLGATLPALVVLDARQGDGAVAGRFVRDLRARHRGKKIPVLLLVDDMLVGANTAPLVRAGGGSVPVERFARAAQLALQAVQSATAGRSNRRQENSSGPPKGVPL